MGFTQRQAGGKFTRDEAEAYIAQLEEAEPLGTTPTAPPVERLSKVERVLRDIPDHQLAAELQRRGWIVAEP